MSTYSDSMLIGPWPFGAIARLMYINPSKLMPPTLNHVNIVCRDESNKEVGGLHRRLRR